MPGRRLPRLLMIAALLMPLPLLAQLRFQEGRHYNLVPVPQTSGTVPAGKIEVAEVFSYICSHCYEWRKLVDEIKSSLPPDAAFTYVHAGFNPGWPYFQRIHLTAQLLGVADRNHDRMFAAIWETAEFPFFDRATGRPRKQPPEIADAARFYAAGGGVTEQQFQAKAASAEVEAAVKRSEALIKAWQISGTPTFVVAGRYRIENSSVTSLAELRALFGYLVGLERARLQKPAGAKQGS